MKLIPIAKPVRIRIKSGGEEHSSLESLKQNFCLEDIKPLLDGRLSRWLQRQGEKEQQLAEELKNFDAQRLNQAEGMFAFLQLFFAQEFEAAHLHSLQEVACHWMKDPVYQSNVGYLLKSFVKPDTKWTDLSLAKEAYKQQLLPNQDWSAIFKSFLDQEDPELYFIYGKLLYEGIGCTKDDETGYSYMDKAATLGYTDAKNYLSIEESKLRDRVIDFIPRFFNLHLNSFGLLYFASFNRDLQQRFGISLKMEEIQNLTTADEITDIIMTKISVLSQIRINKNQTDGLIARRLKGCMVHSI